MKRRLRFVGVVLLALILAAMARPADAGAAPAGGGAAAGTITYTFVFGSRVSMDLTLVGTMGDGVNDYAGVTTLSLFSTSQSPGCFDPVPTPLSCAGPFTYNYEGSIFISYYINSSAGRVATCRGFTLFAQLVQVDVNLVCDEQAPYSGRFALHIAGVQANPDRVPDIALPFAGVYVTQPA